MLAPTGGASGGKGPVPDPAAGTRGGTQPARSVKASHARVARSLDPGRDTDSAPPAAGPEPGCNPSSPDGRATPKSKKVRQSARARERRLAAKRAANVAKAVEARARRTAAASAKRKDAGASVAPVLSRPSRHGKTGKAGGTRAEVLGRSPLPLNPLRAR